MPSRYNQHPVWHIYGAIPAAFSNALAIAIAFALCHCFLQHVDQLPIAAAELVRRVPGPGPGPGPWPVFRALARIPGPGAQYIYIYIYIQRKKNIYIYINKQI